MAVRNVTASLAAALLLTAAPALAQQPTLVPGCTATPAQLEANKKVAMEFLRPGITGPERVALADPSYKQHNPAFVKGGRDAKLNDYDYFTSRFGGPARGAGAGAPAGGRGAVEGPQPPEATRSRS